MIVSKRVGFRFTKLRRPIADSTLLWSFWATPCSDSLLGSLQEEKGQNATIALISLSSSGMFGGLLLIFAVLVLGGVIATLGDRIGTKIGKARLSLFNLRPKKTAVLVTIFTGVMISGVSTTLILLVSEQARVAFFEYDHLQTDLQEAHRQKEQAQKQLQTALAQSVEAQQRLGILKAQFQAAEISEKRMEKQLEKTDTQVKLLEAQKQETEEQIRTVERQKETLKNDAIALQVKLTMLKTERKNLIAQNNQIAFKLAKTQKFDRNLKYSFAADLETIKARVNAYVYQLHTQEVIYKPNEPIAVVVTPENLSIERSQEVLKQILIQVEKTVRSSGAEPLRDESNAVLISVDQVRSLVKQLAEPGDHALQIYAVANAFKGEPVQIKGRISPNKLLFRAGDILATQQLDRALLVTSDENFNPLVDLFKSVNLRARNAGIFVTRDNKVGGISVVDLATMIRDLKKQIGDEPITVQAITPKDIYTAGPLSLTLVAVQNGKVISKAGQ
jgi:uncharacterized protein (DUF3084 family)